MNSLLRDEVSPEQKMQKIVEAAGECWHEYYGPAEKYYACCSKCGESSAVVSNSSHTDLNELFRYAEKLGFAVRLVALFYVSTVDIWKPRQEFEGKGATPAEALLNALYEAVK